MSTSPFRELSVGAAEHFRLHLLAAATRSIEAAARAIGSQEGLMEQFPCVGEYLDAMEALGALPEDGSSFDWAAAIALWQAAGRDSLPLCRLAAGAELDVIDLELVVTVGLVEEDARFVALFDALQAGSAQARPTLGALAEAWREAEPRGLLARVRRLRELGLLVVTNPEAPRQHWCLQVPEPVWDALRGDPAASGASFLRFTPLAALPAEAPLCTDRVSAALLELPALLASGELDAVVVRGPRRNGRRSLLRAIARELARGVLEVELSGKPEVDQARVRSAGPLAALLGALPVLVLEPGAGETVDVPPVPAYRGPLGIVLGVHGGARGPALERAVTLELRMPEPERRARLIAKSVREPPADLTALAARFRMTSGHLVRAARLAEAHARVAGRTRLEAADLRLAARTLGREALDTLATRLPEAGDFSEFSASADTLRELRVLEQRCRCREQLAQGLGPALAHALNPGVRALFQGPSGTGKTLAARLLASALDKDVYRVELSTTVNKYIGETEKNLERIFALAEELDVVLLFDEGDALFARRTSVSTANDRYANLETNFLLQRLESFEGIVLVTTNAGELIDSAFQRRMDVVVDFRAPEPFERWSLWQLHLPAEHGVDGALLREIVTRCQLTGGQIRNAVLHAALLALGDGGRVQSEHLEGAIAREYRKAGGVCPLRPSVAGRA